MKVHFSASIENIDSRIAIYREIRRSICNGGNSLERDWVEDAYKHRGSRYTDKEAIDIVKATRAAIAQCDIAIFEVTDQSFGIGYQAALAAGLQKPLLILQEKGSRPLGAIGMGIDSPLRRHSFYSTVDEAERVINEFIEANDISTKDLRFNMVLERDLFYYLTNESEYTGLSKSQLVRNLLRKAARERSDSI